MANNSNNTPEQNTLSLTPGTDFFFGFRNDQNSWARHGNDTILAFDPAAPIPIPPLLTELEGSADRFNWDILLGDFLDEALAPELFARPELTGKLGRDRFLLGDWRTPYYLDNFVLGLQQQAIIADFQPELDTIVLHGSREDYTVIPFALFGDNPTTGELDVVNGKALVWRGLNPDTQRPDSDILAFFPDVPPGPGLPAGGLPLPVIDLDSESFEYVGNTPPPGPAVAAITQIGTLGIDAAFGVSTDLLGNVYVIGTTTGTLGASNLGSWDTWIAKYDSRGQQVWLTQLGTTHSDIGWDIEAFVTADNQVNLYVTGATTGDLAGPEANEGYQDIWIARLDGDGNVIAIRQNPQPLPGPEIDNSLQIDVDSQGNLYQSGITVEQVDSPLASVQDFAWVASYDQDLDLRWFNGDTLESTDIVGFDETYGVAVSADGSVYATGFTQNNLGGPRIGVYDVWLAKFDANGEERWVNKLGTFNYEFAWGVDTDSQNNAYIAGWTRGDLGGVNASFNENDAFLAKYDEDGNQEWITQFGTAGDDGLFLGDVVVDFADNIYVTGFTNSNLGGVNQGSYDTWVAQYNSLGERQWITQFGSANLDMPTAITADRQGSLFVTGFTEGSLGGLAAGATDAWIAKLDAATGSLQPFRQNPSISIEKKINGEEADTPATAVSVKPKKTITWTYEVSNTGNVAFDLADISVIDDRAQLEPTFVRKSDVGRDRILSPGETWLYRARSKAEDLTTTIDFETDGTGQALSAGTSIDDEYAALGLTISTPRNAFGAMIFDSSNPTGGDFDLGTPNQKFGGPGVGDGVVIASKEKVR
ncbi:MAG: hypothetical protein HC800_09285 [Phormidesmis sp. RL_2_1]|nr:hypothetical protein [Phormidesmis sp. RL_2_1]